MYKLPVWYPLAHVLCSSCGKRILKDHPFVGNCILVDSKNKFIRDKLTDKVDLGVGTKVVFFVNVPDAKRGQVKIRPALRRKKVILVFVKKELKTTQNQICPKKHQKNPPYANFFSTKELFS